MKTVFFDIDTQLDFLYPSGALYVPGAEAIVPAIARLNRLAADRQIPLISTADAHLENDMEFKTWPAHCVLGTLGQRKPAVTVLDKAVAVPCTGPMLDYPDVEQFVIEKQQLDCFTNPNLPNLLKLLGGERYVVYGVVTELCVKCAAMGLLKLGGRVELVSDAVRSLSDPARDQMLAEFTAAGGVLTTAGAVAAQA